MTSDDQLTEPGDDRPGQWNAAPEDLAVGHVVGEYRVLDKLGEGGMGVVYMAEQRGALRRTVALKILKVGMDTQEVVRRFEIERRALAVMDHECVARVYAAGSTTRGRPYFVMEYVEGVSIIEHCNRHRWDIRQRLELFRRVCDGVHHAHQKGVIHRDLKPGNVLVTIRDDVAVPKIIDFGVARAVNRQLHEETVHTEIGRLIGTPEYMSPEQAEMTGQDIDTRADVYSLGVILYELLTGSLPFPREELRRAGFHGLRRIIRERDPELPSTRISQLADGAPDVANERRTDPTHLRRRLHGDLDWITMKALEKDRTRRYGSAEALGQEVDRFLKSLPVEAGPPTTVYRVGKFVRRHRAAVTMATVVAAALLLGAVGTATGWLRARESARRARIEAAANREVSEFLVGLFAVSEPGEARGKSVTAREILDVGVGRIRSELSGQPEVRTRLMHTMGRVYSELGLFAEAQPLLTEAAADAESRPDADMAAVTAVLDDLGRALWRQGKYAEAEEVLMRALDLRRRHFPAEGPAVARGRESMGDLYWDMGRTDEARPHFAAALAAREAALGAEHPDVAATLDKLGALACQAGLYDEARPQFEESLRIRRKVLGPDHPDVAETLRHLGMLEMDVGAYDAAENCFRQALTLRERIYGPDHYLVAQVWDSLALLHWRRGEPDESRMLAEKALAMHRAALGDIHPYVAISCENLATLAMEQGSYTEAKREFDRALDIRRRLGEESSPRVACIYHNRGLLLQDMGDLPAAREDLEQAIAIRTLRFGPHNREVAQSTNALGFVRYAQGDLRGAEQDFRTALAVQLDLLGPDHVDVSWNLEGLGSVQSLTGRLDEGRANLMRALAIREQARGPGHLDLASVYKGLGFNRYVAGDLGNATGYFEQALAVQEKTLPPDHPGILEDCYNLACLYARRGQRLVAMEYLARAADGGFRNPGVAEDPDLVTLRDEPAFADVCARIAGRR